MGGEFFAKPRARDEIRAQSVGDRTNRSEEDEVY